VFHGYKGKGSLIHLLVDGNGEPLAVTTTGANGDERIEVEKLLNQVSTLTLSLKGRAMVLEADKGYDSEWLRTTLLMRGIFPFISFRKTQGRCTPDTSEVMKTFNLVKNRWKVERAFAWLKRRCRRLMTRWERRVLIWNGFVALGLVYAWIKNLLG
jgi:transposase